METDIVTKMLSDGSEVFDVVAIDGSDKIVIHALDESSAMEIQKVLAIHSSGAGVY